MEYSDFSPMDFTAGLNTTDNMATSWSPGQFDFSPYGQDFNTHQGGDVLAENYNPTYDFQGMQDWLGQNNYSLREASDTPTNMTYRGLFDNKKNKSVGAIQEFSNDDPVFKMASLAAASMINPAFIGTQLGVGGLGGTMLGGGVLGTNAALFNGAKTLKDVGMGAITGAAGSGLASFNPAQYAGITNPIAARALNGAVRGGVGASLGRGDPLAGAATGGILGALNGMSSGEPSMDELPGTMGGNMDMGEGFSGGEMSPMQNDANIQAASLDPTAFQGTPLENTYRSYITSANSNGDIGPDSAQQPSALSDVFSNGIPSFGGGRVGLGDFAGGLMGLYQAYDQRKKARQLAGQLGSNYGPNSPYAQRLRGNLQRKDAAAGRRSQYGQREVDFQAQMADVNARMAPTLSTLNQQVGNSNITMANSLLNLGKLFGGKAFNMPSSPGSPQVGGMGSSLPTLQQPMPAANYSLGNPNATLSGINPEWLKTLGNSGGI